MAAARLLRLAVFGVLQQKLAEVNVTSPGLWPVPKEKLPSVLVRAPNVRKESKNVGLPEFVSTVTVEVLGQVKADTPDAAQDAIDDLVFRVEEAVLKGYWVKRVVQQFQGVTCDVEINLDSNAPLAGFKMQFSCETFEDFDPTDVFPDATTWPMPEPLTVTTDLQGVNLHMDAANPFDPSGTYTGSPFPASVTAAPRTSGPDGRDEGALTIDLPQA